MSELIKSRLLNRISKLGYSEKSRVEPSKLKRTLHVTQTRNLADISQFSSTELIDIHSFEDFKAQDPFTLGFIDTDVNFLSGLKITINEEQFGLFKRAYSEYTFFYTQEKLSSDISVLIPLSNEIFDQQTLDQVLLDINFNLSTKISINFNNPNFCTSSDYKGHFTTQLINPAKLYQVYKNRLSQLKSKKDQAKIKLISEALYTVNRLTNEADASDKNATHKSFCKFLIPNKLKAPYTTKNIVNYSCDSATCAMIGVSLGINKKYFEQLGLGSDTSEKFSCLINPKQEAVIYICRKLDSQWYGKVTYKNLTTNQRYSMVELYLAIIYPETDFNKPSILAFQMKLLDQCGLLEKYEVDVASPKGFTPGQVKVFNGFKQLLELKHSIKGQEGDSILFTNTFAALWCEVSRITASKALKLMLSQGIISITESIRSMSKYIFTNVNYLIKEVISEVEQARNVTKAIASSFKRPSTKVKSDITNPKQKKVPDKGGLKSLKRRFSSSLKDQLRISNYQRVVRNE